MIGILDIKMINSFSGEYDWLSNFKSCEIEYEGMIFPSVENAYQAAKTNKVNRHLFLTCGPGKAKSIGREVPLLNNWDNIKVDVMRALVKQKFYQHEDLKAKLFETGDAELIEGNWWGDTFWGVCRGKGSNVLGKLLMEVRKELLS